MTLGARKLMRLGYRLFSVTVIVKVGPLGFLLLHLAVRLFRWMWRLWIQSKQTALSDGGAAAIGCAGTPSVRS
jgi:hypothetical protein